MLWSRDIDQMVRAIYVGGSRSGHLKLPHVGYVEALARYGWVVEHATLIESSDVDPCDYDLILWNGLMPASQLERVKPATTTLVMMNGAGNDLSHYRRLAGRIALATTSLAYFDEPTIGVSLRRFVNRRLISRQYLSMIHDLRRFPVYASPSFWNEIGIPLLYLPFASDPSRFYPRDVEPDLLWGFVGDVRSRPFIRRMIKLSAKHDWPFEVYTQGEPALDPEHLGDFYSRIRLGINEHHSMHCGRELNERAFDLGMAGRFQFTDMASLGAWEFGRYAYFGGPRNGFTRLTDDDITAIIASLISTAPEDVHAYFREKHSFDARLRTLATVLRADILLTDGGHGPVTSTDFGGSPVLFLPARR